MFGPSSAAAQTAPEAPVSAAKLTVSELAGTWIEPFTERDDGEVITQGSENVVEITPDGRFNDRLDVTFQFRSTSIFDGLYRFSSEGRVEIEGGKISWIVERSKIDPVIPEDASDFKREAMRRFAKEVATGMEATETYPIVSYDGTELVMNAGAYDEGQHYTMTRRQ